MRSDSFKMYCYTSQAIVNLLSFCVNSFADLGLKETVIIESFVKQSCTCHCCPQFFEYFSSCLYPLQSCHCSFDSVL